MKKYLLIIMAVAMCLAATACGKTEPEPDKLQTPQYSVAEALDLPEPEQSEIHTAQDGIKVIAPTDTSERETTEADEPASTPLFYMSGATPENIWGEDAVVTYNAFTLPEKAAFDNGSIGYLSIPQIGVSASVYESDNQMEDMNMGAAHFKSTSAWDGNVCLSAHNATVSGNGAYFKDLHKLSAGDSITYRTALGEREYTVTEVKTISDSDWSALNRTADNRLTLITCVNNNASKRLLVQAIQQ